MESKNKSKNALPNTLSNFPIGAIIAYGGDLSIASNLNALNQAGWLLCDGKSYSRTEYNPLFLVIGTANGGSGTNFNVPDLRGNFLRGTLGNGHNTDPDAASRIAAATGGATGNNIGSLQNTATGLPSTKWLVTDAAGHAHTCTHLSSTMHLAWSGSTYTMARWAEPKLVDPAGAHNHTLKGFDEITMPINMALYFIIKASEPQVPTGIIPAGTVIGYGGREIIPDTLWWLKCDGAACAVSSYQNLNDAILYNYGGDGITVFNVPELRGYFLRGTSHLTGRDPDAANRFAINTGGNTGDMIGSAEFYATGTPTALAISEDGAHTHNRTLVPQTNHHAAYGASGFAAYNTMEWTDNATTSSTDGAHGHSIIGGDKETRPRNIYADFYIANEDMAASAPPIGSIMSFGGDTSDIGVILSLAKIGWLACDGSSVRIDQYRALYDVIGTTFGASPLKFSLPDLRGFFAIGAGEIKLGTQQLVSKAGTPNNPIITSTSQNHQHTMDNLPTDTHVIDVVAGWNLAENNTNGSPTSSNGAHTHVITGGDKESRPINVNVDYIIRYQ